MQDAISARRLRWARAVRIIPSHYPPIGLFDEVADPDYLEAVFAVEALTNPRLRDEAGDLSLVSREDRISGPGTTPIMAAFTHPNPDGSRFSPGTYGVYYAARDTETAIAETRFHRERLMRYQDIGPQELHMRAYTGAVDARLMDLRGLRARRPELHDPDSYAASQPFGEATRADKGWGIVYESVRHQGGFCVAIFRPPACRPVAQGAHYIYYYDGRRIERIAELREISP
jgi:hypothetical protein